MEGRYSMRAISAYGIALGAVVGSSIGAHAQVVHVPIDETQSSVFVELVTDIGRDSDTSPLGGFLDIELDNYQSPGAITVHDFFIDVLEPIDLEIDVFLVGRFTMTAQGVTARYATPGVPLGPVVVDDSGQFILTQVPALLTGVVDYEATGVFCDFLQGQQLPCSDVIDLSTLGPVLLDTLGGTVTVANDEVTIVSSASVSQDVQGFATVNADGTIVGSAPVPVCEADLDGNGVLDAGDFFLYLDLFVAGDPRADFEGDGDLDAEDFFAFLDAFTAGC